MATPETKAGRVCRPGEIEHLIVGDRRLGTCTQCARVAKKDQLCTVAYWAPLSSRLVEGIRALVGSSRAAGE